MIRKIRNFIAIHIFLILALFIIDKKSIEGFALAITINDYIDYLNNDMSKQKQKYNLK